VRHLWGCELMNLRNNHFNGSTNYTTSRFEEKSKWTTNPIYRIMSEGHSELFISTWFTLRTKETYPCEMRGRRLTCALELVPSQLTHTIPLQSPTNRPVNIQITLINIDLPTGSVAKWIAFPSLPSGVCVRNQVDLTLFLTFCKWECVFANSSFKIVTL